ncbi:ribosome-associated translation inhibitor RaiA [Candidatus Methylomirabilis sp.]|uniref:ribosome hibernation-promoting factor, HPF/YfiA family n=1 Tax=Candidatus Methylomirabilis sp. TaxID=2032687 RepID=UPI002A5B37B7|nr:ribosome-associated translation inhibitor RaiA [Candidatus Methylomirabilis sp.]
MQITITTRNIENTEALKRYAEEKIARLQKFVDQITSVHIILSVEKHRQIAEVTLHVRELTIRGEESSTDLYSAIDLVADKIERQILRYKEKIVDHSGRGLGRLRSKEETVSAEAEPSWEEGPRIVKTKHFAMKPLSPDEAAIQMDLVGHNFFVFRNARTQEVNVLYRRRDGDYGLIEPRS